MSNRLINSQSLYLRKHAENPIDWWYWGNEALQTAKAENKPIFLSIGYSSCHWCTVMEGEAFSDRAIAEYLNANFLPIKVDREERPDIDSIYMQTLQMMTGQGGWPLNVFLTPGDLIPFYGGTYFPVEPRYGRPGFLELLKAIRRFYDTETEKLDSFKQEILDNLQRSTLLPMGSIDSLNEALLSQGIEIDTSIISPNSNDYGNPRFPMIPYATIALAGVQYNSDKALEVSQQRGEDLTLGGIFDHVAGGFHRYTVDSSWTVPHFEKMLYDNGQILEYLANLWSAGIEEPAFRRAIAKTVKWLKREMTAPAGYFYAAQDADNFVNPEEEEPEEGDFYVWDYTQLQELLSDRELEELQTEFTVTSEGNFEGKNVLQRHHRGELSESLEKTLDRLFIPRYGNSETEITIFPPARNNHEAKTGNWQGRIPPVTDTKAIAAWNSLTISGLARSYAVFLDASYLDLAAGAINFILDNQWVEGRFQRLNYDGVAVVAAQSEDYALLIKTLLDLQACLPTENKWLVQAQRIQQEFDELLWSVELGGYYNSAPDNASDLLIGERSYMDNAIPAANGVAIANLVRLSLLTENLDYLDKAERTLQAFSSIMQESPQACPSLFTALDWYLNGTLVRAPETTLQQLIPRYLPTTVYRLETDLPQGAIGLVCKGLTCLEPALSMEQLLKQIRD
jgi:uncharacterized protein YyaL (SSP411 family)